MTKETIKYIFPPTSRELFVYAGVTPIRETLEHHDHRDEEELLAHVEHVLGRSGSDEVQDVLDRGQVRLSAL